MSRQRIEHTATTTASPSAVYALLREGATWPSWGPLDSFERPEARLIARTLKDHSKAAVGRFFEDAKDDELIEKNPFRGLAGKKNPRISQPGFEIISEEQLQRFAGAALNARRDEYRHTLHAIVHYLMGLE